MNDACGPRRVLLATEKRMRRIAAARGRGGERRDRNESCRGRRRGAQRPPVGRSGYRSPAVKKADLDQRDGSRRGRPSAGDGAVLGAAWGRYWLWRFAFAAAFRFGAAFPLTAGAGPA